jgi:Skp family chaperone for outer membrane proteins
MKKLFPALLIATCFFALGAQAANEIVFVDLQEVFKRFYKTQLAQDQIRQQASDITMERDTMAAEIKNMKDEVELLRIDSRDKTLSEEVRDAKRSLLEEKLVKLQKRDQEMLDYEKLRNQQLEQQNTRMSRQLFDEIHAAVNKYAIQKGYAAVIDRSAQSRAGTQVILYTSGKNDITAEIILLLNEGHEVDATKDTPNTNAE